MGVPQAITPQVFDIRHIFCGLMENLIEETKFVLVECLVNAGLEKEVASHQIVTENILSRPPFSFIHSLVRTLTMSKKVMFAQKLYSARELDVTIKKSRLEKVSDEIEPSS